MAPSVMTVAKLACLSFSTVISAAAVGPERFGPPSTPLSSSSASAASCLAEATPIAGNGISPPGDGSSPSGNGSCTAMAFHMPQFTAGPVRTIWTTTVTSTMSYDCGGCSHVASKVIPFGHGPEVNFTTTVTATDATTTFTFTCMTPAETHQMPAATLPSGSEGSATAFSAVSFSQGEPNHDVVAAFPSSSPLEKSTSGHKVVAASQTVPSAPSVPTQQGELHHHKAAGYCRSDDDHDDNDNDHDNDTDMPTQTTPSLLSTISARGITSPTCTTTFALAPNRLRSTLTIYPSTVTHTSRVYCGPCALIWSTAVSELPTTPIVYAATKTTKKPATETHLKCHKFTMKKSSKKPTPTSTTFSTVTDAATASPFTTATTGENEMENDTGDQDETEAEEHDDDD